MSKKSMNQKQKKYFQSIRKQILRKLGYEKYVPPNDPEFKQYSNILHQVKNFIDSLADQGSPFKWFDFTTENKKVFVKLCVSLINRPSKNHQIYMQMDDLSTKTDFQLFTRDFKSINIYDIYKNNPQFTPLIHATFRKIKEIITDITKVYRIKNYRETVKKLKYINNDILKRIENARNELYDANYFISLPMYMEEYMKLVDYIVNTFIYLIFFRCVLCDEDTTRISPEEVFDKLIDGTKKIQKKVKEVLDNLNNDRIIGKDGKSIRNTNCDEKIIKFSYYLERKAVYKESSEIMELLCNEIKNNPEEFDLKSRQLNYIDEIKRTKASDKNYEAKTEKVLVAELKKVTNYKEKIKTIRKLMTFAKDDYQNAFIDYNYSGINALFREIYIIKTKHPTLKITATTIVRDFESEELFKEPKESYTDEELKIQEQKLRFLDLKFMRGIMVNYLPAHCYVKYCELKRMIWDTFLLSYSNIDDYYICRTVNYIGDGLINLLLDV